MKSIRPLFRPNGRMGTPQCHDAFQQWIGDPLQGDHNKPLEVRRGTLRTELLPSPDGSGYKLIGYPAPKAGTIPWIVAQAKKRTRLLDQEAASLQELLTKTIERKAYREWLASSGLAHWFYEDDWTEEDNYRKFNLYALACFVDFLRPGQLDWRTPNLADMHLVDKLLRIFSNSRDAEKQRKLLHGLFDLKQDLRKIVVESTTALSRKDQELLLDCHRLRLEGEERARWLRKHGFKAFGKSALTKYRENPNAMRAQLSKWTREVLGD